MVVLADIRQGKRFINRQNYWLNYFDAFQGLSSRRLYWFNRFENDKLSQINAFLGPLQTLAICKHRPIPEDLKNYMQF